MNTAANTIAAKQPHPLGRPTSAPNDAFTALGFDFDSALQAAIQTGDEQATPNEEETPIDQPSIAARYRIKQRKSTMEAIAVDSLAHGIAHPTLPPDTNLPRTGSASYAAPSQISLLTNASSIDQRGALSSRHESTSNALLSHATGAPEASNANLELSVANLSGGKEISTPNFTSPREANSQTAVVPRDERNRPESESSRGAGTSAPSLVTKHTESQILPNLAAPPPADANALPHAEMTTARPNAVGRELSHRIAFRAEKPVGTNDDTDRNAPRASALSSAGQILGVVGSLRLEGDHPDRQDAALETSADRIVASPNPQVAEPVTSRHLTTIPISTPVASPQWSEAFGSAVVQMAASEIGEATLTLSPDELGSISVKIGIDGSIVSVGFSTDNKDVRDAVAASMSMLEDMLAKSGLSLGESSVGRDHSNGGTQPQPGSRRTVATSTTSAPNAVAPTASRRMADDALVDIFA
ncbi:MAG: flagellar hook-length control protein FliK [Betaproteobacteria bacterium]